MILFLSTGTLNHLPTQEQLSGTKLEHVTFANTRSILSFLTANTRTSRTSRNIQLSSLSVSASLLPLSLIASSQPAQESFFLLARKVQVKL